MEETVAESAVQGARELRITVGRLRRRFKRTYDNEGLTPSQTSALSRLDKEGPASASELAEAEGVRHQSITSTLNALDERGLIQRRADPQDGRRQLVSVSEAGHALLEDKRRAGEEWLARALHDRYTERERQTLLKAMALLERLTEA
ncbi:MarR family transcriptional regulator [Amycolatopsis cynarae]|uniref:MarR family transcriptional regulator n=1 Tax=Amycolatopsis cynarae TaxID=2995223 RepID=A0ABY7BBR9_9PSEU|nr:MarR family transcriptional regulator [Amycolatopsis sp. HUAS 11-8]WAL69389.1 MarR family transcriptional regulator [Amycolatopsis sp. HUAS 11-8]